MSSTDAAMSRSFTPWERVLQKLSLFIIMAQIIGPFWYWPLALFLCYIHSFTCGLMVGYFIYIFFVDNKALMLPQGDDFIRRLPFWKNLANYFPVKLIKTCDLDPKANYVFAAHPHGVACFSHTANFLTEATGFSQQFPGISLYPLLLDSHFFAPFHREIALRAGFRGASKQSCLNLLTARPGSSILLMPGGAAEALKAQPGTYDIILLKRKGFVRTALQTGAALVPVLAFGESSLFEVDQPDPRSVMGKIQKTILKLTGFAFPQLSGEGLWPGAKAFRPLPRPLPVTTVVGRPIQVSRWTGSTTGADFNAAVDELHQRYCRELRSLWDAHKDTLAPRAPAAAATAMPTSSSKGQPDSYAHLTDGKVCYRRKSLTFVE